MLLRLLKPIIERFSWHLGWVETPKFWDFRNIFVFSRQALIGVTCTNTSSNSSPVSFLIKVYVAVILEGTFAYFANFIQISFYFLSRGSSTYWSVFFRHFIHTTDLKRNPFFETKMARCLVPSTITAGNIFDLGMAWNIRGSYLIKWKTRSLRYWNSCTLVVEKQNLLCWMLV